MKVLHEFREFAVKGNVVDLAVGVIIGASFGAIVRSLVDDVIMPVVGLLTGDVDFQDKYWVLKGGENLQGNETVAQAKAAGAVTVNYGLFANTIVTFLIVAFAVFLLVRQVNRLRRERKTLAPDPTDKKCPFCYSTIPVQATKCAHCASRLPAPRRAR